MQVFLQRATLKPLPGRPQSPSRLPFVPPACSPRSRREKYTLLPTRKTERKSDLTAQGQLARVQCVEVQCPMTSNFAQEYRNDSRSMHFKQLLSVMNPNKARSLEYLVRFHENRGDKIIIFSDLKVPLVFYAEMLRRGMLHGETMGWEQDFFLKQFRDNKILTLCLSRVGDMAINLPDANVVIQVSSHFGARQQEAQRMGRIMHPKSRLHEGTHDPWFYTLVSNDTKEVDFSAKRRQYLIDQGYTFKIIGTRG